MLVVLSPAKTQEISDLSGLPPLTKPAFLKQTTELHSVLQKLSVSKISSLMSVSKKIAELNFERFQDFRSSLPLKKSTAAVFMFQGDVYTGLQADTFSKADIAFAQKHLRIISGFYGLLRPLDQVMPYRLEMKTRLKVGHRKDLYDFWGTLLQHKLEEELSRHSSKALINLASNEYSKALHLKDFNHQVVSVDFKELKGKKATTVALFAKKARGLMAQYIVKNKLTKPAQLQKFQEEGYKFQSDLSSDDKLVFHR